MASKTALIDRLLTAVYTREPHVKVVVAVTGGGTSAAELLFRAGSSSTMLQYSVPYARSSLAQYLQDPKAVTSISRSKFPTKFCSVEMAEQMAVSAWKQALELSRRESEVSDTNSSESIAKTLERFRTTIGIGCTAGLATNYVKQGPHQCFLSVCRAQFSPAGMLTPQCETLHLDLSKTKGRTRSEEDHIVSVWLVYLLAKSAEVDPEGCTALHKMLISDQDPADSVTSVTALKDDTTEYINGIIPATDELFSLSFLSPSSTAHHEGESDRVTIVRDLDFRGLVLSGSFNPLHQGHVSLALAAQKLVKERLGADLPITFEIAVANADKGAISSATVLDRVGQFGPQSQVGLGEWPVIVTNAPLFSQKAVILKGCTFVIGADTAVRIVDKKYYGMDEHKMVLMLHEMAQNGCMFIVAGRVDDKQGGRYISARDVVENDVPAVLRHLFLPLEESEFRNDISSTHIRNSQMK